MKKDKQKAENKNIKENFREKKRSAEILAVFTKHNFYTAGFTPEELRTTLEDLGPTYVKIGQIMSSRTDMLPESYCRELEKLRSSVKPLDAEVVRSVIEEETGKKIDELYSEFRDKPLGSASIAQAHFGVLKDGTKVVTKVQRPYIAEMVLKDFVLLKKIASVVNIAAESNEGGNAVDLRSVIDELEKVTEEELDFRIEAENTKQFRKFCIEDESKISCPKIIDSLTTKRILTMTFVDGYPLSKNERIDADHIDRNEAGKAIVENYLHQVLDVGIFHGDPHQGNIMISGGIPYWIDFGMIGRISDKSINVVQEIVFSLARRDPEKLTNAVLSMGTVSGKVNRGKLTEDIEEMIERYVSVKNLSDIDLGALMTEMTGMLSAHNIAMPGEYTMLVRSLVTIEGVLESFCPELNLFDFLTKKMLERAKENFDIREKFAEAVNAVSMAGLGAVNAPGLAFDALRNLVKGRLKINFEITGYEPLLEKLNAAVKDIVLAIFACVIFTGSCTLCTTNIEPRYSGMPVVSLFGFIFSAALGIHTVSNMTKRK